MAGSPNFPNDGSMYDGYDANTTSTSTADSIQVPSVPMTDFASTPPSTSDDTGAGVGSATFPMFPDHDAPNSGA